MFCTGCGKQMEENAAFCKFCGKEAAKIVPAASAEIGGGVSMDPAQAQKQEDRILPQVAQTAEEPAPSPVMQYPAVPATPTRQLPADERLIMGHTIPQWKKMRYWEKIRAADKPMRWFIVLPILCAVIVAFGVFYFMQASMAIDAGVMDVSTVQTILTLASMGLGIAVFILLWRFKKLGFWLLIALFGIGIISLIVSIIEMQGMSISTLTLPYQYIDMVKMVATVMICVFGLIPEIVILVLSIFYFKKRSHLLY